MILFSGSWVNPDEGDVIPMLSQNSSEMEVNSREQACGRALTVAGVVGDAEIFPAASFELCHHGLWVFVGK